MDDACAGREGRGVGWAATAGGEEEGEGEEKEGKGRGTARGTWWDP